MGKEIFEKAEIIVEDYKSRKYRVPDLAKKYGMSIEKIRAILKAYGFEHTKLKSNCNPNNLNDGQKVSLFVNANKFAFLDDYDI